MKATTDRALRALLICSVIASFPSRAQQEEFVSSDVDLDINAGQHEAFPGEISKHAAGTYLLESDLSVPGDLANNIVDGLHDFGAPQWLFSLKPSSNNDLGGQLSPPADQRDVIRYDGVGYSHFFCGPSVEDPVPEGSDIDAIYMDGTDLIVSFDVPTLIGGVDYLPSDLVRYTPTGEGGCSAWRLAASPLEFDSSGRIELSRNVTGAAKTATGIVLAIDQDAILETAPGTTASFRRGQLVRWDGSFFSEYRALANWPARNLVSALSLPTTPVPAGSVSPGGSAGLAVFKNGEDLDLSWSSSCLSGDADYAIYEGVFGDFTSHVPRTCSTQGRVSATITPGSNGSHYYLVVPQSETREGSHGTVDLPGPGGVAERPVGISSCRLQEIGACPVNLLPNGDMEAWVTPTDLVAWIEINAPGPVEQEADPAAVAEGSFAARLTRTGAGVLGLFQLNLPLTPGQDYTLTLSARYDVVEANAVQVRIYNITSGDDLQADGSWAPGQHSFDYALTTDYQTFSIPFTVDPGFAPGDDLRVVLRHRFTSAIGRVLWLDDVRIEE